MRNERLTLIAWFCLGLIGLNGAGELFMLGRAALGRESDSTEMAAATKSEDSAHKHDHPASCHEEETASSAPACAHCTAACETGAGHVCGMGGSSGYTGGIVFGVPHCQGIPPSSPDYIPASFAFVFLPVQTAAMIPMHAPATLMINPEFDFSDFDLTPPSPPPEFTIA